MINRMRPPQEAARGGARGIARSWRPSGPFFGASAGQGESRAKAQLLAFLLQSGAGPYHLTREKSGVFDALKGPASSAYRSPHPKIMNVT
jgi:hypothetical protein